MARSSHKKKSKKRTSRETVFDNAVTLPPPSYTYVVVDCLINSVRDYWGAGTCLFNSTFIAPVVATADLISKVPRTLKRAFPSDRKEEIASLEKRIKTLEREVKKLSLLQQQTTHGGGSFIASPSRLSLTLSPSVAAAAEVCIAAAAAPPPPPLPMPVPPPPPMAKTPKAAAIPKPVAAKVTSANIENMPPTLGAIVAKREQLRKSSSVVSNTPAPLSTSTGQPVISLKDITNVRLKKTSPKKKSKDNAPLSFALRKVDILRSPGGTPLRREGGGGTSPVQKSPKTPKGSSTAHQASPRSPYELLSVR